MTSFTLDLPTNEPITLDCVTKQELAILKNMRNPPELVMRILLAVLFLRPSPHLHDDRSAFRSVQHFLSDINCLAMLHHYLYHIEITHYMARYVTSDFQYLYF